MRELTESEIYEHQTLGHQMDHRPFNGSTRFINFMLTLIALLASSAIGGAFVMTGDISTLKSQVRDLQDKVNLIIDGRISIPAGQRSREGHD